MILVHLVTEHIDRGGVGRSVHYGHCGGSGDTSSRGRFSSGKALFCVEISDSNVFGTMVLSIDSYTFVTVTFDPRGFRAHHCHYRTGPIDD